MAALFSMISAFSQEAVPTFIRDANLKGNVSAVQYSQYWYKENFGEPTLGGLRNMDVTFYDDKGRSILYRSLKASNGAVAETAFFDYQEDNGITNVHRPTINSYNRDNALDKYKQAILSTDSSFEGLMKTTPNYYGGDGLRIGNMAEFVYDKYQVMTSYTLKENKYSNYKIIAKMVGKPTATPNLYNFVIYDSRGDKVQESQRTFKNGRLVKEDNENYKGISRQTEIRFVDAGTYTYNEQGNLTLISMKQDNRQKKYVLNAHGDVVKVLSNMKIGQKWRGWSEDEFYENYQYDNQGNWISRTYGTKAGEPKYVEKRTIVYCASTDELKEKATLIQNTAGKAVSEVQ